MLISNIFPPGFIGGYELGAAEIASGLIDRGHRVDVLTSNYLFDDSGGDAGQDGSATVHRSLDCAEPNRSPREQSERVWLGGCSLPHNLRELSGRLRTLQPDAVLCFNLAGLGAPAILRLLVASGMRPVVYCMDQIFATLCVDPSRKRAFERVFSTADWPDTARFLFMSQRLREEIEEALGLVVKHAQIVPGWFDGAADRPVAAREHPTTRFVFASRVAPHKGVDLLLDAARSLLDGGREDFSVDIYGAGEVAMMLQRLTALRLQNHVRYCGSPPKAALMPVLCRYDALLFPTLHREPFGFIVAEAAVSGCIPVMTFGIGASEWFLDGVDCIKTGRDAPSLHAAMLQIMGMEAAGRNAMRRRAQATAHRFLRFDDALTSIEKTLHEAARPAVHDARVMQSALAVLTEIWRERMHA